MHDSTSSVPRMDILMKDRNFRLISELLIPERNIKQRFFQILQFYNKSRSTRLLLASLKNILVSEAQMKLYESIRPYIPNDHQVEYNMLAPYIQSRIRVIRLRRKGATPLGFSIRGGCEHGTGVFVSEVVNGSEAQRQGLRVGDQIIRINGFNIELAIHEEVLSLLRSKPGVVLKVKSVGMIPVKDPSPSLLTELGLMEVATERENQSIITRASRSPSLPVIHTAPIFSFSSSSKKDDDTSDINVVTAAEVHSPDILTGEHPFSGEVVVLNNYSIKDATTTDSMDQVVLDANYLSNTETTSERKIDKNEPRTIEPHIKTDSPEDNLQETGNKINQDTDTIKEGLQVYNLTNSATNDKVLINTVSSVVAVHDHINAVCTNADLLQHELTKLTESQDIAVYAIETALSLALTFTEEESKRKDPLTWKIVNPGMSPSNSSHDGSNSYSGSSSLEDFVEAKVTISAIGSSGIGCTIVKGPPDVPGIFVQTVKADGLAELAGLQVGDQVLQMNGFSFLDIDFSEAVTLLKSSKEMTLTVRQGAGLDLFPEEKIRRTSRLLNGVKHTTKDEMKRLSLVREEDSSTEDRSSIFTSSSSLTTNGTSTAMHSRQDSLVNGITSASEKDFSLSELEESARAESTPVTNGVHHVEPTVAPTKTVTFEVDTRPVQEEDSLKKQEERLEEERRKLAEEQRRLKEEAERLAEERRKLEEEKKMKQETQHSLPPSPLPKNFLSELQNFSHHRKSSSVSSTVSAASEDFKTTCTKQTTSTLDKSKYQDEMVKRKQHEMLMQEFQQMHKKMFGVQNINPKEKTKVDVKQTAIKEESQSNMVMLNRRQRACETSAHPPPPPPPMQRTASQPNLLDQTDRHQSKETPNTEDTEQTASGDRMLTRRGSLYIPPLSTNPHMFVDPTTIKSPPVINEPRKSSIVISSPTLVNVNGESPPPSPPAEKKNVVVTSSKFSKDLPITDSMGPAPRPPQTYFDKPAKTPLVTIGIYPDNSRQNRFIYNESEPRQLHAGSNGSTSGNLVNNRIQPQFNISMTSSQGSVSSGSSTTSSPKPERKSSSNSTAPVSFKVTYDPKTATSVNSITVTKSPLTNGQTNVPKVTISVNTKKGNAGKDQIGSKNSLLTNGAVKNGLPEPKSLHPMLKKVPGSVEKLDPMKMLTEEQIGGREVKTLNLAKNGPLNMKVEGGINSELGGKIIISEVWEGGLIPTSAGLQKGDQILMVDDTLLVDISLVLANTALRNAMCSTKEKLRLLIAKAPKES